MEPIKIKKQYRVLLWCISAIGLFGVNGLFVYSVLFEPQLIREAMDNLLAMLFVAEAFLLLILFSILVAFSRLRSPNWMGFLVLSLLGSLAFSIPFCILLWTREKK